MKSYHWECVYVRPPGATCWSSGTSGSDPVWRDRNATIKQLMAEAAHSACDNIIDYFELTTEVPGFGKYGGKLTIRKIDVNGDDLPISRQVVNHRLKSSIKKHESLPDGTPFIWYEVPENYKGVLT